MSMIFWYMGSSFHGSLSAVIIAQRTPATLMNPPCRTTIVHNTVRALSLSIPQVLYYDYAYNICFILYCNKILYAA